MWGCDNLIRHLFVSRTPTNKECLLGFSELPGLGFFSPAAENLFPVVIKILLLPFVTNERKHGVQYVEYMLVKTRHEYLPTLWDFMNDLHLVLKFTNETSGKQMLHFLTASCLPILMGNWKQRGLINQQNLFLCLLISILNIHITPKQMWRKEFLKKPFMLSNSVDMLIKRGEK